MTRTEIENMVRRYNIFAMDDGRICARPDAGKKCFTDAEKVEISAAKPELLNYFAEVKAEAASRAAKIAAIEGIKEIEAIQSEWETYFYKRDRAFESECGRFPTAPKTEISSVKAKYPRAAAYLLAQSYSFASNYEKAHAGRNALERIINGEDHDTVIAEMKSEWEAAAHEAVMNS